jgi:hypothetical protein
VDVLPLGRRLPAGWPNPIECSTSACAVNTHTFRLYILSLINHVLIPLKPGYIQVSSKNPRAVVLIVIQESTEPKTTEINSQFYYKKLSTWKPVTIIKTA